jgi:hypothetical protein
VSGDPKSRERNQRRYAAIKADPAAYAALREYNRKRYHARVATTEGRTKARENRRRYRRKHREKENLARRRAKLARNFGLTEAEYTAQLTSQGGMCAICGRRCKRKLAVDHDHVTGAVRGLLCMHCNLGMGHFRDSTGLLLAALGYLRSKA